MISGAEMVQRKSFDITLEFQGRPKVYRLEIREKPPSLIESARTEKRINKRGVSQ